MTSKTLLFGLAVLLVAAAGAVKFAPTPAEPAAREFTRPAEPVESRIELRVASSTAAVVPLRIEEATRMKYRYLLAEIGEDSPAYARVAALLQKHEDAQRTSQAHDTIDTELASVLSATQFSLYSMLQDSNAEQAAANDFTAGLEHASPLTEAQRRELLLSKLRHKQEYASWEQQSGIEREQLSTQEREYAHSTLARALFAYRDAYLQDMRAQLSAEQFQRLSDYETTEFNIRLQRVQEWINSR